MLHHKMDMNLLGLPPQMSLPSYSSESEVKVGVGEGRDKDSTIESSSIEKPLSVLCWSSQTARLVTSEEKRSVQDSRARTLHH